MPQAMLLLHSSLVLSIGVLAGIPYWVSILGDAAPTTIQRWRVTHAFLTVDGLFMLVFGLAMPALELGEIARQLFALALVASGWGFVFAFVIGAITGHRGLAPAPFGPNTLCFVAHAVGAMGSLLALAFAVYGFFEASKTEGAAIGAVPTSHRGFVLNRMAEPARDPCPSHARSCHPKCFVLPHAHTREDEAMYELSAAGVRSRGSLFFLSSLTCPAPTAAGQERR